ncbi:hypothetical protein [Streptomyces synnematoformans]|uniref:Uncharacterized protein n=1 Tax=Streptomyces synnematoformans TaxID=415721 RepID=A0ABP5IU79_9ACTN
MLVKGALAATFDRTESLTMERGTAVVPEQIETMADRWVKRGEDRADMMREVLCPRASGPG